MNFVVFLLFFDIKNLIYSNRESFQTTSKQAINQRVTESHKKNIEQARKKQHTVPITQTHTN